MSNTTPAYVTVVGTIGVEPASATTKGGSAVANSALYDNRSEDPARRLYTLTAYGSAVETLMAFAKGDLVLVRARSFEKHWARDGKSGIERVLVMTNVAKVLRRKGEGPKPAAEKQAA